MAITPQYQAYLHSPEWKSKRLKVFNRAKFKCEKCKRKQATQVHHLTYKRIFHEPLTDLLAVCGNCHRKIHGIKSKKRRRFFGKVKRVYARMIR